MSAEREYVFIGASWCGPCRQTYPLFARICAELGAEHEYIDVEDGDVRSTGVMAVPTLRVYEEGDVIAEHVGGASEVQIRALFRGAEDAE